MDFQNRLNKPQVIFDENRSNKSQTVLDGDSLHYSGGGLSFSFLFIFIKYLKNHSKSKQSHK